MPKKVHESRAIIVGHRNPKEKLETRNQYGYTNSCEWLACRKTPKVIRSYSIKTESLARGNFVFVFSFFYFLNKYLTHFNISSVHDINSIPLVISIVKKIKSLCLKEKSVSAFSSALM